MLRALELYLLPLVDAALPAATDVVPGPYLVTPAWPPARRVLNVHALRLDVHDVPPPRTVTNAAFDFQSTSWPINGVIDSFTLPPALIGEVVEVEAPVGHLAKLGDDYYLDGTTVRFFRAPVGPGEARARVRVAAASGYIRRSPATITLDLYAYTNDPTTADPLLEGALQVVLVQLDRAPYFAAQSIAGYGTSVRFSDFRAHVLHIERKLANVETVVSCAARLELVGELDLLVPTGAPAPIDVIEQIDGEVMVEGGDDDSAPLEIHIEMTEGGGG